MSLKQRMQTSRLTLYPIDERDAEFIQKLVNTEGWKKYIGDRNVESILDAKSYIQKMNSQVDSQNWTVVLEESNEKIGIISYIKRDYLPFHDLGFAFLPSYQKQGFAFEAANSVLNFFRAQNGFQHLLATTIPENIDSIGLLEKLGFASEKTIEEEGERLLVYKL